MRAWTASLTALLLVGALDAAGAAAATKPPTFHGTANLSSAGRVTVVWKASSKQVRTVQVRVTARIGGKTVAANGSARYKAQSRGVLIKGGTSLAASAVTYRGRNCSKARGHTVCGAWSKAKHPTLAGPSVTSTATAPGPATTPPATTATGSGPSLGGCQMLPADSAFNQDVSSLPVDPRSNAYLDSIGVSGHVHPDFGAADLGQGPGGFGIPYRVVPATQPLLPLAFGSDGYPDESDRGNVPIPLDTPVEGGSDPSGDRHVLVVQQGECKLYELYRAFAGSTGWTADQSSVWNLATGVRTSGTHPGWTSADAAGLPILPGLARYDEVAGGAINHALRMTVPKSQQAYIAPASHAAGSSTDPNLPPMGLRLRMRADYDLAGFRGQSLVIATALKKYGLIVADNGSPWYISGAPSTSWSDDDLNQLKAIPGSAFEVVQTGTVVRP